MFGSEEEKKNAAVFENGEFAQTDPSQPDVVSLENSIHEVHSALNLFLDNEFKAAEQRLAAFADKSIYHAMGYSTLMFIKAIMSCEEQDIILGMNTIRSACNVIEGMRARTTLHSAIYGSLGRTAPLNDVEAHAELCYAEVLLFRAVLAFLTDDNFSSFLVGALKIRTSYQTYKKCFKMLHNVSCWRQNANICEVLRREFESGTRMGIGLFNLLLSTLPTRVLRLLEVVGFSGNKAIGFKELNCASLLDGALRAPMAALALLSWHLFASFLLGAGEPRVDLCHQLLAPFLSRHPNGAITLFFKARIAFVEGNFLNAIHYYRKSIASQTIYRQFHHASYWELMFCHWCCRRWVHAANYAKYLLDESRWSSCVYTYALAALLHADETVVGFQKQDTVLLLFRQVPNLRLRIAGKSIPIEKFCEKKARHHLLQTHIYWPHYEFFYFFNGFALMERVPHQVLPILNDIDTFWKKHPSNNVDDYCLYQFLCGVCLRVLGQNKTAEECFFNIVRRDTLLTDFNYLAPNACFELAVLYSREGSTRASSAMLAKAKSYHGYALETKLHFKMHHFQEQLDTRHSPQIHQY